jgi:hypothetical protein
LLRLGITRQQPPLLLPQLKGRGGQFGGFLGLVSRCRFRCHLIRPVCNRLLLQKFQNYAAMITAARLLRRS